MAFFTWFGNILSGSTSDQRNVGIQVTGPVTTPDSTITPEDTVLSISAVYASIRIISDSISTLPFGVFKLQPDGTVLPSNDHWFAQLFAGKVNQYQTATEFWQVVVAQLVLHGNAYVRIGKLGNKIISLLPLMSNQVRVILDPDGSVKYQYSTAQGQFFFQPEEIWHLKLRGNGVIGMSPLNYAQPVFGIAASASSSASKILANGGKPAGVLSLDRPLKPSQREEIRTNFASLTDSQQQRLLVLEYGMKFEAISLTPEAVQLLESRKFSVEEISRIFGVPMPLLNANNGSLGAGLEQIILGYVKFTLLPYLKLIENSIETNLFTKVDRKSYQVRFDTDPLLSSTTSDRFAAYKDGILSTILTPNEVRAKESLPRAPGGDMLLVPANMIPMDKLESRYAAMATEASLSSPSNTNTSAKPK